MMHFVDSSMITIQINTCQSTIPSEAVGVDSLSNLNNNLITLPQELLSHIFNKFFWASSDIYRLNLVCKRFYNINERHPKLKLVKILFQLSQTLIPSNISFNMSSLVGTFSTLSMSENETITAADLKIFRKMTEKCPAKEVWSQFLKYLPSLYPNGLTWINKLMNCLPWKPLIVAQAKINAIVEMAKSINEINHLFKMKVWSYQLINEINWSHFLKLERILIRDFLVFPSFFPPIEGLLLKKLQQITNIQDLNEKAILALIKINQAFYNLNKRKRIISYIFDKLPREYFNKNFILKACQQNGDILFFISEDLKNDREIVLTAVNQNGLALKHASIVLKGDKEIALVATKQSGGAVEWIAPYLNNDKDIILTAVKNFGLALKYASVELKNDKDVVLAAVKQDGRALCYASDILKNDEDVVLAAVQQNGIAFKYTTVNLKNDKKIAIEAIKNNFRAIRYISEALKLDKQIILTVIKHSNKTFLCIPSYFKNDKEVVLAVVQRHGYALEGASDELKNDKEIVLTAAQQDIKALKYASAKLTSDKEFIAQIKQNIHDQRYYQK